MPTDESIIGIQFFFQQTELLVTFFIAMLGLMFGNLKLKGVGFGSSGVLIVAMLAGYLWNFAPVKILSDLGIVLFLLCVGLEAGPSFFRAFKKHGRLFITNVLVLLTIAFAIVVILIYATGIKIGIGLGLFAGAFTSSPALVSAMQFSPEQQVIFGYGVAYPFGLLGVILFINIMVKLLRRRMDAEIKGRSRMHTAVYRMENKDMDGRLIRDIQFFQDKSVVVSGILREMALLPAGGKTSILKGDLLRLEGEEADVRAVGELFGEAVATEFKQDADLDSRNIVVENLSLLNRTLNDIGIRLRFNVSITRVIRSDVEIVPHQDLILEHGDVVVAVGTAHQLDQIEMFLGHEHRAVQPRVDINSLAATLFLAFAIGGVILPLPELGSFSLGLAGGALVAGLIFGHFGRIGNFIGRFPRNATAVLKELGLALFFVQVGFETGRSFVENLNWNAAYYAVYAVLFAVLPMLGTFLFGHFVLRISISQCFGVICGGMTFTPGLDIIRQVDDSEQPVVAYSSVYPVALILVIGLVQAMYLALVALGAPT